MPSVESVKNNFLKIMFGSAGSIIAIVVAMFAVDARYAHAVDVNKEKLQTQDLIQDTSQTLRRQQLEDKLFEADLVVKRAQSKGKQPDPVDIALRDRYQRELDNVNRAQTRNRNLNKSLPRD